MTYNPDYYKNYYRQNKDNILSARGERYHKDVRYREGILRRARVAAVIRTLTHRKQKEAIRVIHDGKPEKVFYVIQMSQMVNRDISVLYDWRKSDPPILPSPLYFDKRNRGMYSESQIMFISKALHRLDTGTVSMNYEELRLLLKDVWNETFSERVLTTKIREVLHGKHYVPKEIQKRRVRKSTGSE